MNLRELEHIHAEHDQSEIIGSVLLTTGRNATVLLEPADQSFAPCCAPGRSPCESRADEGDPCGSGGGSDPFNEQLRHGQPSRMIPVAHRGRRWRTTADHRPRLQDHRRRKMEFGAGLGGEA